MDWYIYPSIAICVGVLDLLFFPNHRRWFFTKIGLEEVDLKEDEEATYKVSNNTTFFSAAAARALVEDEDGKPKGSYTGKVYGVDGKTRLNEFGNQIQCLHNLKTNWDRRNDVVGRAEMLKRSSFTAEEIWISFQKLDEDARRNEESDSAKFILTDKAWRDLRRCLGLRPDVDKPAAAEKADAPAEPEQSSSGLELSGADDTMDWQGQIPADLRGGPTIGRMGLGRITGRNASIVDDD